MFFSGPVFPPDIFEARQKPWSVVKFIWKADGLLMDVFYIKSSSRTLNSIARMLANENHYAVLSQVVTNEE